MLKFKILFVAFVILSPSAQAQDSLLVGKKYYEDQIYFLVANNVMVNKPESAHQNGLSSALHLGFIKDIPINKKGSLATAIGLGYGYDKYQQNIRISDENITYITDNYLKNKLELHKIELPVELRYRNSSDIVYKFWRIYVGGKLSYTVKSRAVYENEQGKFTANAKSYIAEWQYGPQISVGYNSWNIYLFWSQSKIFDHATLEELNAMQTLQFGIQLYVF